MCRKWLDIGLDRSPEITTRSKERCKGMWSLKAAIFANLERWQQAAEEWLE
jgi:hypothetical protein